MFSFWDYSGSNCSNTLTRVVGLSFVVPCFVIFYLLCFSFTGHNFTVRMTLSKEASETRPAKEKPT